MALLHHATCPAICLRDFVAAQVASKISRCNMPSLLHRRAYRLVPYLPLERRSLKGLSI